jgi:TRAP-type C4-dicarboxylate transport system substrate-binding protein
LKADIVKIIGGEEMRKRKKAISFIAVICLVLFTLAGCNWNKAADTPPPAADTGGSGAAVGDSSAGASEFDGAPTFDLKISHPHPKGSGTDLGYEKLAEMMETYSEGTIKSTVYPAGSLMSTAEAVEAIRNGTADIAQISSGDVATIIPAINLIEIPGSYSQKNTDYVEAVKPVMREIMEPYGIYFLSPQPGTPSWFFSNLKQIKTPADMKGIKVRASGQYGGKAIEAWGGSPVTITLADLTTAMERNTVDVVITPGLGAYSNGWYELEHYITVTDISTLMAMMVMNMDLYNRMTPAQQDAVNRATIDAAQFMYDETVKEVAEGFPVMEAYGNEIYTMTDAENDEFKNALQPMRDAAVAEFGDDAKKLEDVLKTVR